MCQSAKLRGTFLADCFTMKWNPIRYSVLDFALLWKLEYTGLRVKDFSIFNWYRETTIILEEIKLCLILLKSLNSN